MTTPARTLANAARPLYWSLRRELWENRSITAAPLAASAIVLLGFSIHAIHLPRDVRALSALAPAAQAASLVKPYDLAAVVILLAALFVALVYCLGALQSERRDRSILFWKSLPVSDLTTVLGKALVPLAILPLVAVATTIGLQLVMLLLGTAILLLDGESAALLWARLPLPRMGLELLYGVATLTLWYAPIYLWLLLVSGWARRAASLWAVLPPLALCAVERIAFGTTTIFTWLIHRLGGSFAASFTDGAPDSAPQPDPLKFLATPGLWVGLALAAGFLAATIRLRHHRDPI